jgi:hypothetical protein
MTTQTSTNKKSIRALPKEVAGIESKSGKIRALAAMGWERGDIARTLEIRYQHVRNVLLTPLKKQG